MVDKQELDDVFNAYLQDQYKDEKIGEGDEFEEDDDPDYYDYGDLSDEDEMVSKSNVKSQA